MKRILVIFATAALTMLPACEGPTFSAATISAESKQRLSDVKKIFVPKLGNSEGSELIRQKVINRLIKSGSVTVVESSTNADAVLVGDAELSRRSLLHG